MGKLKKLSHTYWNCTYHIITIPKYRFKSINRDIETDLRNFIYKLCTNWRITVNSINIQKDHVHMVLTIPPHKSVSQVMGYLKGKSAIYIFKKYSNLYKTYWGQHFWARGYCVMTTGYSTDEIMKYVEYAQKQQVKG